MHTRLRELLDYTDEARRDLQRLLEPLGPREWDARSHAGGWTVRDIVGHLHLVEDSTVRALFKAFRRAREAGLGPETAETSLLDSLDWSRLPVVVNPVQAPSFTTPMDRPDPAGLFERLSKSRQGLHTWAAEANGFALDEVRFPHPALGNITLYQWVLMIGQHERRHLAQIQRILEEAAADTPFTNRAGSTLEEGAKYTASLLELLGDRDPLAVWAESADAIDALTAGLSEADARRPEAPGKWCIAQVLSHLVDTEIVYGYRVRLIVAEDTPPIQGYDQDLWATRLHYTDDPLETLRNELRVLRGRNLRFARGLSATERARVGLHNERGPESVWHIIRLLAAHDLLHRNQIRRIKRALGLDA
ncbi:MAG: DinB family protein [Gemmatimonadaceae bacterium]|nr:DinB family protein [Gemmatimonadaceae bacterium]